MMKGFPTSYKDDTYNRLDSATEKRLGIPSGSVASLRLFGEKSNADQVSSVGARTPYQFTPTTRKLIIKKYGVDPYLSPENASEAAGLLMKESLERNNGDIEQAIGEYHGGTNRKAWGRVNSAYRARVMSGIQENKSLFSEDRAPEQTSAPASDAPSDLDALYAFVKSGSSESVEKAPAATESSQAAAQTDTAIPKEDLDALYAFASQPDNSSLGQMPQADTRGMIERGVDAAKESITGADRKVATTEALGDWTQLPELQGQNFFGDSVAAGMISNLNPLNQIADLATNPRGTLTKAVTNFTGADETAQILKSQFPDLQVSQDEKGNYLFISPTDGKTYAYKPGFRASDVPRAAAQTAAYTVGAPETIVGRSLLSAGVQAGVEAAESAAGGNFDAEQVALAGAAVPAIEVPMKAAGKLIKAGAQKIFPRAGADAGAGVAAVADDAIAPQVDITPPAALDEAVAPQVDIDDAAFSDLVKRARNGNQDARSELTKAISSNPELVDAAKRLDIELPPDLLSDSRQLSEVAAAGRGIQASPDSVAWNDTRKKINEKLENTLKEIGAADDISVVSQKVKDNLDADMTAARNESQKIYKEIDNFVPKNTSAVVSETKAALQKTIEEMGGAERLNSSEKRLWDLVNDPKTTVAAMNREREEIGAAIGGRNSSYTPQGESRSDISALKRIYGAMAQDKYQTVLDVGGKEYADKLLIANKLNGTARKIEQRIIDGFGAEGEGSVVKRLKSAISSGKEGDITALNKILKILPPENKKEVLMSGIMSLSKKNDHFNVGAFESIYRGLRENSKVYAKFSEHLSPQDQTILRDMYLISKRVNAAEQLISKTGKSNQPLIKALMEGNLVQRLAESSGGQIAAKYTAPVTMGVVSPSAIIEKIAKTPTDRLLAVTKFLGSDEFVNLLKQQPGSSGERVAINRLAGSKSFANLAKKIGVKREFSERQKFISGMLQAVTQESTEGEKK